MKQVVQVIEPMQQPIMIHATFLRYEPKEADEGWQLEELRLHPILDGEILSPLPDYDDALTEIASHLVLRVLAESLNSES